MTDIAPRTPFSVAPSWVKKTMLSGAAALSAALLAAGPADARPANFFSFEAVSGDVPQCVQRAYGAVLNYGLQVPRTWNFGVAGWSQNSHVSLLCVQRNGGVTAVIFVSGDEDAFDEARAIRDYLQQEMRY